MSLWLMEANAGTHTHTPQATRKRSNAAQISDKEVASELASVNPDIFEDPDVREYLELFSSDDMTEVCFVCCQSLGCVSLLLLYHALVSSNLLRLPFHGTRSTLFYV